MTLDRRALLRRLASLGIAIGTGASVFRRRSQAQAAITGKVLFARPNGLWVWENGKADQILKDENVSDPCWSPDGSQIALIRAGNSYSNLCIFTPADNTLYQVTYNMSDLEEGTLDYTLYSAWALDADWSASGLIGFMSDSGSVDGSFQLWLVSDPSEGAYLAPTAQFEDNIDSLSLSADGSLAAYSVQEQQDDGTRLNRAILRDLSDGIAYPLAETLNAFDPSIAPDQQNVAVAVRADDGTSDIYLIDRATGEQTRITNGLQATNPAWSRDGAWLAYVRMINYQFEVWATPMAGPVPGEPVKIFKARDFDARSGISWKM
jgi:Tol biopolymer transport system component